MQRKRISFLCGVSLAAVMIAAGGARAQVDLGPVTATGSVEAGGFAQGVPASNVAKYQEYRDLAQQLIAPQLKLLLGDKEQRYYFNFNAVNVSQYNEMYRLRFGEYGLLDVQAEWFEIPHAFSNDVASTPYVHAGGTFALTSRPPAPTPGAPAGKNVEDWVNANAKPFDMSLLEGVAKLNVRYTPTTAWTFSANFNYQNPTGEQPLGASFLFGPNPGTFNVNELFFPQQFYIYNFGAGAEYARNGWLIGLQYQGSFFHNANDTLTWDNPDTWGNAGAPGSCTDNAAYSPSGGTGPCRGEAALYPDNQAHNFILTLGATLPYNTHLMGDFEYGFWLQDQPFIPFTINKALAQPLQHGSLGGDVRPAFVNVSLESNPIKPLDVRATYSYYDYDNQTGTLTFTNVKSLNDVLNDNNPNSPWTATANPFSFAIQDIRLSPTYDITPTLAARMSGDITTYHNDGLMVLQQTETTYGPSLDWTPKPWLMFQASYQHGHRDSPGYNNNRASLVSQNSGDTELDVLRRFDEATVDVNQTSLQAQMMLRENLSFFAQFNYDDDNYPASDTGLQHESSYSPGVGVDYAPKRGIHLYADYAWEAYDWSLRSMQRQPYFGAPPPDPNCPAGNADAQNPTNCPSAVWSGYGRTQGNSVTAGLDVSIPENPFLIRPSLLKLQYTYTVGSNLIHANGDSAFPPGAVDFPNTGSQFHELILKYQYMVRKNLSLNVGYYFTHFGETDFGVDNIRNWMSATPYSTYLGNTNMNPYDANAAFITVKASF